MTIRALANAIEEIDRRVTELIGLVSNGLGLATEALLASDKEVAGRVVQGDSHVDHLYEEIEALIQRSFTLETPMANDMRYLLSMLRVVPELERCGDLVEHIATRALRNLGDALTPRVRGVVERMGMVGTEMWLGVAELYAQRDPEAVHRLNERDDEMDDLHGLLMAEVVDAELSLPVAMEMALVARFYERLGDHAVNIANRIRYAAAGLGMLNKHESSESL